MRIAIQAADLDNSRIDGTRVYLWNILKHFGKISKKDDFFIYHKDNFNKELKPAKFPNYYRRKVRSPFIWTQSKFAWSVWRDGADVLWMPMHNIPIIRSKKLKTIITIHDLAFKKFPGTFPKKNLVKLNFLTDLAIKKSNKIIAVSKSTKKDILKFYPNISENKIKIIYHGFDANLFRKNFPEEKTEKTLSQFKIRKNHYLLYVGAIQPRKNIKVLIEAFNIYKKKHNTSIKLVLAGEKAWNWKEVISSIENSAFRKDIVLTGLLSFKQIAIIYKNASLFVFPSLYEGFGIPLLEAFASEIPVISAKNSSLVEIGDDAVEFFNDSNPIELSEKIRNILKNNRYKQEMIKRGLKRLQKFSWEKCAQETLAYLKD